MTASLDIIKDLVVEAGIAELPRRAAAKAPAAWAFRGAGGDLTYGDLDGRIDRCAGALRTVLGRRGAVVAVAQILDPTFAVAYYGVARSGNVSAIVNPLLHAEGLARLLATCQADAAIVTPEMWAGLEPLRHTLPRLTTVLLTAPSPAASTLAELMADAEPAEPAWTDPAWTDTASIVFTSGTTGAPKAVPLTHRNLTVNAAQTVDAQDLCATSVMFNYFPTFHTMHLNAAVLAGATQVLYRSPDVAGSIEEANRHGVTHYYSLPMRLAQLTRTALPDRPIRTAHALLSGGSALAPRAAAELAHRFGIPVVQGYGFAEASPLTHFNRIDDPRPGSCGRPVAGTECRIVDIDTRIPLPAGEKGEVQIRGPQLMRGYLGQADIPATDGDGWFSTGDVAELDADGYLYLTDRLGDVFKCDNFLVSPTEIENELRHHPDVLDCVVVGIPDPVHGAVANGLAVFRTPDTDPASVRRTINARLPSFMRLARLDPVAEIARTRHGKVRRREIREQLLDRLSHRLSDRAAT